MVSPADRRKLTKLTVLCNEIELITGWRTGSIYANEGDALPCGILVGDAHFFELLNGDEDDT